MTRLARSTVLVLLTLIGLALVWLFREPILLFLLAVALAASLRPLIDRLQHRVSPGISVAIVYLMLGLGIVAMLFLAIGPLYGDVQDLLNHLATTYERVAAQWPESPLEFQRTVANVLPKPDLLYKALSGQTDVPVFQGVASLASGAGSLLGKGITILILSLYWSVDHVRFERLWLTTMPLATRGRVRRVWRDLEEGVGTLLRNTFADKLPPEILGRKDKMGFPTPLTQWTRGVAKDFVFDTLLSSHARQRGLYQSAEIEKAIRNEGEYGRVVWGLLCLELWHRTFIDGATDLAA